MKHLVCLFDGTWNSAASGRYEDITNIFRLNLAISRSDAKSNSQVVFYIPGPGNRGKIDKEFGGAFGSGLDQIVREAYVSLSSNFSPGDKIYLFGFSRGAVAARALSSLISDSGLLKPIYLHHLADAWSQFVQVNRKQAQNPNRPDLTHRVHRDVKIEFVGLFDSVLGRDFHKPDRFSDLVFADDSVSPIVEGGLQLLAIDENRRRFEPMIWGEKTPTQRIDQVWMPGVHGDIGGVGRPRFLGIASLLTMIAHVKAETDLRINTEAVKKFEKFLGASDSISIMDNDRSIYNHLLRKQVRRANNKHLYDRCHHLFDIMYQRRIRIGRNTKYYIGDHHSPFIKMDRYKNSVGDVLEGFAHEAFELG